QNFAVESFAGILSEARKYRLCLTMAHQYIAQLTEPVRDAVFGNVGTMLTFRVGSPDAIFMEQEFTPRFLPEDIINLPKYNVYLKLLIDGVTSQPFSAITLPEISQVTNSAEKVIKVSRERYAAPRKDIEDMVMEWSGLGDVSDDDLRKEADRKRKASSGGGGGGKPKFEYNCTRCDSNVTLPVELDRSRPIYCDDCIKIVREERKSGKKSKPVIKKKVVPKPSEGELVEEKLPEEPSISLGSLMKEPKKEAAKVEPEPVEKPEVDTIAESVVPEVAPPTQKKEVKKVVVEQKTQAPEPSVNLLEHIEEPPAAEVKEEVPPTPKPIEQPAPVVPTQVEKPVPDTVPQKAAARSVAAKRKEEPRKKRGHDYHCSECSAEFTAPVKLDPSRPLYCGDCLDKKRAKQREEKASGKSESKTEREPKKSGHRYDCSECSKNFEAPVKLDPSRPLYCNDCLEKKRAAKRAERDTQKEVGSDGEAPKKKRKRKRKSKTPESQERGTIRLVTSDNKPTPEVESTDFSLDEAPAPKPQITEEAPAPRVEVKQEPAEPKTSAPEPKTEPAPKVEVVPEPVVPKPQAPKPETVKEVPVPKVELKPAPTQEPKPVPKPVPPKPESANSGTLRSGQSVSFD
ncbi:MAG: hypothetical protein P8J32_08175, partial [bacterium]|nr:hypothetical protein [bacterium]